MWLKSRLSQTSHLWHFGPRSPLRGRGLPCPVGCLTASLASPDSMLVATLTAPQNCDNQKHLQTFPCDLCRAKLLQARSSGQKHPQQYIDSMVLMDFPMAQMVKNPPANTRDTSLIPGSGRSPGGGNGNPLQDSCLEEPVDRGAWRANSLWGSQELDTTDSARSSTAASNLVTTIRIYSGLPCIYYSFTHILTEFSKQPMNQVLLLSSLYRCGVWGPEDGSH